MAINDEENDDQLGNCNKNNITVVNYLWYISNDLYCCTSNHVDFQSITKIVPNTYKCNNCFNNYIPLKLKNNNNDTKYSYQNY